MLDEGVEVIESASSKILKYPVDSDDICARAFGFPPKPEQREVVEQIGRGEDCILIAGCGWGKTSVGEPVGAFIATMLQLFKKARLEDNDTKRRLFYTPGFSGRSPPPFQK
ncbi:hypothetical protein BGZ94_002295 [Podila epigama]|nr:hypothetical protein BGZ94_002295 [Podila epigama]